MVRKCLAKLQKVNMKKCHIPKLFDKPNPFERMDGWLILLFSKALKPQNIAGCFLFFSLLAFSGVSFAQSNVDAPKNPEIENYSPILQFLASPELEGRETGTPGSYIAAYYIAAMMQGMGLKPFHGNDKVQSTKLSDYFQTFCLLKFSTTSGTVVVKSGGKKSSKHLQLKLYKDFTVKNAFQNVQLETTPVFVGYGINASGLSYNDYANTDVKGKLVIVFDGYPGQHDTLSAAWKKFKSSAENDVYDFDHKCREALQQGAAAMMVIDENFLKSTNEKSASAKADNPDDTHYRDADYFLPSNKPNFSIPCFQFTENGSRQLSEAFDIDFKDIEQKIADQVYTKVNASKVQISLNLQSVVDTLIVYNVIGTWPGQDTTKTVILGAHYDHLGKRGSDIFYGSDDNASGVAGMLALAATWTAYKTIPPFNITFASWAAEEKGLIGSEYFTSSLAAPENVKLYINMDMISRSVVEDTAQRQLSIGTRTADEHIREIARKSNATLNRPFELDLWDVTGHSGSDYASFTAKNIPIMTYNTGLHNDYHTPRDIPANADLIKMGDVLKVVNACLWEFVGNAIMR